MKIAIVDLKNQFSRNCLKVRPCVVLKQSKKHITVLPITHHPDRKSIVTSIHIDNGHYNGYINMTKKFTIERENLIRLADTLTEQNEKLVRAGLNEYEQRNFLKSF